MVAADDRGGLRRICSRKSKVTLMGKKMEFPIWEIHGYWGSDKEGPAEFAGRFTSMLDMLGKIDPVFGNWIFVGGNEQPISVASLRQGNKLANFMKTHSVVHDDEGKPEPNSGYSFGAINSMVTNPRSISIRIHAGTAPVRPFPNDAVLSTNLRYEPDPAIIAYKVFAPAMMALVTTWNLVWCLAGPWKLNKLRPRSSGNSESYFRAAWLTYLAAPWSKAITPPRSAIAEPQADGGLLLAATRDTFDVGNPAHVAAADDILACLAPADAVLRELAGAKNRQ